MTPHLDGSTGEGHSDPDTDLPVTRRKRGGMSFTSASMISCFVIFPSWRSSSFSVPSASRPTNAPNPRARTTPMEVHRRPRRLRRAAPHSFRFGYAQRILVEQDQIGIREGVNARRPLGLRECEQNSRVRPIKFDSKEVLKATEASEGTRRCFTAFLRNSLDARNGTDITFR